MHFKTKVVGGAALGLSEFSAQTRWPEWYLVAVASLASLGWFGGKYPASLLLGLLSENPAQVEMERGSTRAVACAAVAAQCDTRWATGSKS